MVRMDTQIFKKLGKIFCHYLKTFSIFQAIEGFTDGFCNFQAVSSENIALVKVWNIVEGSKL